MLVVTRSKGEVVRVGEDIKVTILNIADGRVDLEFDAPETVGVIEDEMCVQMQISGIEQEEGVAVSSGVQNNEPSFKPGDAPHLNFGNEVLNEGVQWDFLVLELLDKGRTIELIATRLGVDAAIVKGIIKQDYSQLNFKTGAKLCSLHCELYPEKYGF